MAIEKNLYDQTDWALLRKQKLALIEAIDSHVCVGDSSPLLSGLLHFIDAVQDDAEMKGYPVFPDDDDNTCEECVEHVSPVIERAEVESSHCTHRLPDTLTAMNITNRLKFHPARDGYADGKVTMEWQFTVDGHECAIRDYKGSRWSAYDPDGVLDKVFPELVKG